MSEHEPFSDKFYASAAGSVATQCVYCKHRAAGNLPVCVPFPGWIPEEIQANRFDHRKPHPDEEQPVRFEPRDDVPGPVLDQLYAALDAIR